MSAHHDFLDRQFGLRGRTALITGGSSGIGRAIAEALASAVARVVVLARREAPLRTTVDALRASGHQADWVSADLADREALHDAAERAAGVFGEPDILVTAAGVNLRPPLDDLTEAEWDTTMSVNLDARSCWVGASARRWRGAAGAGSFTSPRSNRFGPSATAVRTECRRRPSRRWRAPRRRRSRATASPSTHWHRALSVRR